MAMQIEIYSPTNGHPLPPVEWNYTAVKQWLEDGLSAYKGRVYTEDTVTEAKKDRANLNKLADAIDTKRKEMKAMYLEPYALFETQAKELTAMVKEQVAEIDAQVKTFENFRKQEKLDRIRAELYEPLIGNLAALIPYEKLHDVKWLNVTVNLSTVAEEIARKIERITKGLSAIDSLELESDIAVQVKDVFLKHFDLAEAIDEKDRLIRQKAELERIKAEQRERKVFDASDPDAFKNAQPGDIIRFGGAGCECAPVETKTPTPTQPVADDADEKIHTVTFRIRVTSAQLKGLGDYMKANGIRPERV